MKKLMGYTLFWFALGMIFQLLLENIVIALILISVFLLVGYCLFKI
ncbi:MAG: hypothetical protein IIW54_09805 [Lachnospiraceae bacterium]|nr:hypothetical protein [Lachnospiraceae bacterium]